MARSANRRRCRGPREPRRHLLSSSFSRAFAAESRPEVDAFWRRGVDAGYTSDGEPGLRPQYHPNYYGGFLLDPDGNSVEALYRDEGNIGHGMGSSLR